MDAHHRSVGQGDQRHGTRGLEDLRLAVAREVVGVRHDLAVQLGGPGRRQTHRRHLGRGVGDPRDVVVVDVRGAQPGEALREEDALGESDVGELEPRP